MARHPGVPEPAGTMASHHEVLLALKELVEVLTRQRGDIMNAAVTWQDLLDLELVDPDQVPRK